MNNDLTNLERTILRIEDTQYYTLCNIDTLIRVNDPEEVLYDCNRCIYQDTKELGYTRCSIRQSLKKVLK